VRPHNPDALLDALEANGSPACVGMARNIRARRRLAARRAAEARPSEGHVQEVRNTLAAQGPAAEAGVATHRWRGSTEVAFRSAGGIRRSLAGARAGDPSSAPAAPCDRQEDAMNDSQAATAVAPA